MPRRKSGRRKGRPALWSGEWSDPDRYDLLDMLDELMRGRSLEPYVLAEQVLTGRAHSRQDMITLGNKLQKLLKDVSLWLAVKSVKHGKIKEYTKEEILAQARSIVWECIVWSTLTPAEQQQLAAAHKVVVELCRKLEDADRHLRARAHSPETVPKGTL
jgi:hypothetical protein